MLTLKNFLRTFQERILDKNLPLEHFVFLCVASAGAATALVGVIGNAYLSLGPIPLIAPSVFLVIDILCIVRSFKTTRWKRPAFVAVGSAVFFLLPSLWFSVGGATGSTVSLAVTGGLCIVLIFKGRLRAAMLILDVLMCVSFIALEYYYPGIYTPYPSRFAWYMDLVVGVIMNFLVVSILAYIVMSRYERARDEEAALASRLERISITDPLTGIYNRRFLTSSIDEEMRKAYESDSFLCVSILDVDLFKGINDNYGHLYGDEVLFGLAQTLRSCVLGDDVLGRYGGEEFLILFIDRTPEEALAILSHICDKVRDIVWPHGGGITLSCGLGVYKKGISYSKFIESADKNLYRAKSGGRDRIVAD